MLVNALCCRYVRRMMYFVAGNDLGTRIRRARERKRWTQRQLAGALGVSLRAVGSWERGVTEPRNSLGALEAALAPHFSADGQPDELPLPADPRERELWDLAIQDMPPAAAWEVIEEYRRRKRRSA